MARRSLVVCSFAMLQLKSAGWCVAFWHRMFMISLPMISSVDAFWELDDTFTFRHSDVFLNELLLWLVDLLSPAIIAFTNRFQVTFTLTSWSSQMARDIALHLCAADLALIHGNDTTSIPNWLWTWLSGVMMLSVFFLATMAVSCFLFAPVSLSMQEKLDGFLPCLLEKFHATVKIKNGSWWCCVQIHSLFWQGSCFQNLTLFGKSVQVHHCPWHGVH